MTNTAVDTQAMPKPNDSLPIIALVMKDLAVRGEFGKQKYGTYLQANNGRDPLLDLYYELLDATCYARQMIEERDARQNKEPVEESNKEETHTCNCGHGHRAG